MEKFNTTLIRYPVSGVIYYLLLREAFRMTRGASRTAWKLVDFLRPHPRRVNAIWTYIIWRSLKF